MPKKTKKQKLQAGTNRIQKKREMQDRSLEPVRVTITPEQKVSHTALDPDKESKPHAVFKENKQEKQFFLHDLTKTLIITVLLICVQVGLYILQVSGTIDIRNMLSF